MTGALLYKIVMGQASPALQGFLKRKRADVMPLFERAAAQIEETKAAKEGRVLRTYAVVFEGKVIREVRAGSFTAVPILLHSSLPEIRTQTSYQNPIVVVGPTSTAGYYQSAVGGYRWRGLDDSQAKAARLVVERSGRITLPPEFINIPDKPAAIRAYGRQREFLGGWPTADASALRAAVRKALQLANFERDLIKWTMDGLTIVPSEIRLGDGASRLARKARRLLLKAQRETQASSGDIFVSASAGIYRVGKGPRLQPLLIKGTMDKAFRALVAALEDREEKRAQKEKKAPPRFQALADPEMLRRLNREDPDAVRYAIDRGQELIPGIRFQDAITVFRTHMGTLSDDAAWDRYVEEVHREGRVQSREEKSGETIPQKYVRLSLALDDRGIGELLRQIRAMPVPEIRALLRAKGAGGFAKQYKQDVLAALEYHTGKRRWIRKDHLEREDGQRKSIARGTKVRLIRTQSPSSRGTQGRVSTSIGVGTVVESGKTNASAAKRAIGTTAAVLVEWPPLAPSAAKPEEKRAPKKPAKKPAKKITFSKMETFEGAQEAFMIVDGENVGTLRRERPGKMGTNFRTVIDTSAPWQYTAEFEDVTLNIADGTNLRAAKQQMIAAYTATKKPAKKAPKKPAKKVSKLAKRVAALKEPWTEKIVWRGRGGGEASWMPTGYPEFFVLKGAQPARKGKYQVFYVVPETRGAGDLTGTYQTGFSTIKQLREYLQEHSALNDPSIVVTEPSLPSGYSITDKGELEYRGMRSVPYADPKRRPVTTVKSTNTARGRQYLVGKTVIANSFTVRTMGSRASILVTFTEAGKRLLALPRRAKTLDLKLEETRFSSRDMSTGSLAARLQRQALLVLDRLYLSRQGRAAKQVPVPKRERGAKPIPTHRAKFGSKEYEARRLRNALNEYRQDYANGMPRSLAAVGQIDLAAEMAAQRYPAFKKQAAELKRLVDKPEFGLSEETRAVQIYEEMISQLDPNFGGEGPF